MPSNCLILCRPLLFLPSIFPSIGVLSKESVLHIRWPKYWSFRFSINPTNGYSGLISFRVDWLDLLAVQGILKSLLQHHSLKASILGCSAFFIVQLSNLYVTAGKAIALTRWTFVGQVMFLLFNMLSRLVITFLPRSKRLPVLWLQSPSAVIFKPFKVNNIITSKNALILKNKVITICKCYGSIWIRYKFYVIIENKKTSFVASDIFVILFAILKVNFHWIKDKLFHKGY